MGNHLLKLGRPSATQRIIVMGGGVALSVLLSLAPAAFAETYTVPNPLLEGYPFAGIGTNGDNASGDVVITHGGCATESSTAIAIGESNRQCQDDWGGWKNGAWTADSEANGSNLAVGLLGADAHSFGAAVASDGNAYGECPDFDSCAAVSGTGSAWAPVAVSATGPATSQYDDRYNGFIYGLAVSGTGDAYADNATSIAVSGMGDAEAIGEHGTAVSGIGTARSRGCTGDPTQDATRYAVSVTGNAYGCNAISVTGETGPG